MSSICYNKPDLFSMSRSDVIQGSDADSAWSRLNVFFLCRRLEDWESDSGFVLFDICNYPIKL